MSEKMHAASISSSEQINVDAVTVEREVLTGAEKFSSSIEVAQALLTDIKQYEGAVIRDAELYKAIEEIAAELSTWLAGIPSEVRVANGLPGGVIHAPGAANDEQYQVAA